MKQQTFTSYLWNQFRLPAEGMITDFLSRRRGQLWFGHRINLNMLAADYGTPLEVAFYPQISNQVHQMIRWAHQARQTTRYVGNFFYAYATKANFAAEVVDTALAAGAHYETSAAADVEIAHYLWQQGILPPDRLICCNGSKEPAYLDAILRLRLEGYANIIPILDDLDELEALCACRLPLMMGVRARHGDDEQGAHGGHTRFGLTPHEIEQVIRRLRNTPHRLVMYHTMIGSQVEDQELFLGALQDRAVAYAQLRQRVPTLRIFNFGGGVPTAGYRLDFQFAYRDFLQQLMRCVQHACAAMRVPVPDLLGEFGRYTVATHSLYLFEVGQVKTSIGDAPDWYLINGSMMVSIPDSLLVDQEFIVLPLSDWDAPLRPVRLAGRRTCDSDDVYPPLAHAPLMLPNTGRGLIVAVFGVGAYQQMISGRGGAHHCLSPEPRRVHISDVDGHLVIQTTPPQDRATMMQLIGYPAERSVVPLRRAS